MQSNVDEKEKEIEMIRDRYNEDQIKELRRNIVENQPSRTGRPAYKFYML